MVRSFDMLKIEFQPRTVFKGQSQKVQQALLFRLASITSTSSKSECETNELTFTGHEEEDRTMNW